MYVACMHACMYLNKYVCVRACARVLEQCQSMTFVSMFTNHIAQVYYNLLIEFPDLNFGCPQRQIYYFLSVPPKLYVNLGCLCCCPLFNRGSYLKLVNVAYFFFLVLPPEMTICISGTFSFWHTISYILLVSLHSIFLHKITFSYVKDQM